MRFSLNSERAGWIPTFGDLTYNLAAQYGWIHGLSVTEMEIVHGAFRKCNPNGKCIVLAQSEHKGRGVGGWHPQMKGGVGDTLKWRVEWGDLIIGRVGWPLNPPPPFIATYSETSHSWFNQIFRHFFSSVFNPRWWLCVETTRGFKRCVCWPKFVRAAETHQTKASYLWAVSGKDLSPSQSATDFVVVLRDE